MKRIILIITIILSQLGCTLKNEKTPYYKAIVHGVSYECTEYYLDEDNRADLYNCTTISGSKKFNLKRVSDIVEVVD